MPPDLLSEYKAYYAVRAEKYAGNPNYAFSYEAEKNLSQAMQSCNKLEEFKDAIGDLNERCATALIKDDAIIEREHFRKHKEDVRIKASIEILEKADEQKGVMELITMVNKVMNRNMLEITADEAQRQLFHDWDSINMAEIFAHAEVPDKYKQDMQNSAQWYRDYVKDNARDLALEMRKYIPDWNFQPDIIMAHRHRRLSPFSDEHILEQLAKYKTMINL